MVTLVNMAEYLANTVNVDYVWRHPVKTESGGVGRGCFVQVYEFDASASPPDDYSSLQKNLQFQDDANFPTETLFSFGEAAGDVIYLGHWLQFDSIQADMTTSTLQTGASATIVWEYWNGTAWTALTGVTDGTDSFKGNTLSAVTWTTPGDWATTTLNSDGMALYYVRARLSSGTYTVAPTPDAIWWRDSYVQGSGNMGVAGPPNTLWQLNTLVASQWTAIPDTNAFIVNDALDGWLYSWRFRDIDIQNTELEMYAGPIDYADDDVFGVSFGFWYHMIFRGHMNDTVDGSFPDQLGFTCGFSYNYRASKTSREIEFSVVDEQDDTNFLGPYLRVRLYDNNETNPDNRGLPVGETFTMRNPADKSLWRWEYRDPDPVTEAAGAKYWIHDKGSRVFFVGFALQQEPLPDGTLFYKCQFYQNGRFTTVVADEETEVPHEILHQTPRNMFLWTMYDDGTTAPEIERTNPHLAMLPFLAKRPLTKEEWDNIYFKSARQEFGLTGTFDLVTEAAPPIRSLDHVNDIRGNQLRTMHHTHSVGGNAVVVEPPVIAKRFRLIVTGAPDSTTDIEVALDSFNVAKSISVPEPVSFTTPYTEEMFDAINDRPNGVLKFEYGEADTVGTVVFSEYLTATRSDVRLNESTTSRSISIEGSYIVPTPGSSATYEVVATQVSSHRVEGGVPYIKLEFNKDILPGDVINYQGGTTNAFAVQHIKLTGSVDSLVFEIRSTDAPSTSGPDQIPEQKERYRGFVQDPNYRDSVGSSRLGGSWNDD